MYNSADPYTCAAGQKQRCKHALEKHLIHCAGSHSGEGSPRSPCVFTLSRCGTSKFVRPTALIKPLPCRSASHLAASTLLGSFLEAPWLRTCEHASMREGSLAERARHRKLSQAQQLLYLRQLQDFSAPTLEVVRVIQYDILTRKKISPAVYAFCPKQLLRGLSTPGQSAWQPGWCLTLTCWAVSEVFEHWASGKVRW